MHNAYALAMFMRMQMQNASMHAKPLTVQMPNAYAHSQCLCEYAHASIGHCCSSLCTCGASNSKLCIRNVYANAHAWAVHAMHNAYAFAMFMRMQMQNANHFM